MAHDGEAKRALIKIGYPVEDLAGYEDGEALAVELRETTRGGKPFGLREYQESAVDAYHASGGVAGGSGRAGAAPAAQVKRSSASARFPASSSTRWCSPPTLWRYASGAMN